MSAGYAITTYKIQLNYKHLDWLKETQALFDHVLAFYYQLLEKQPEALSLSNQNLLRHLELQTIKQRDGTLPETPLPFEKVPLYFRRAAINAAISMYRSYTSKLKAWEEKQMENGKWKMENSGTESQSDSESNQIGDADLHHNSPLKSAKNPVGNDALIVPQSGSSLQKGKPSPPKHFHMSMLYYKGMYKDFADGEIMLKLYTGKSWAWVKHHYTGRPFPENAELMSPTIVIKKKKVMLHIPVKEIVEDSRTAKERVKQNETFVAVALTGSDSLAVCTTIQADGSATHPYFIKGGKELAHRRKLLIGYTKRGIAKDSSPYGQIVGNDALVVPKGDLPLTGRPNAKYYDKITRLTDHYAHEVSRKIVDYAVNQGAKLIVLPELKESFAQAKKPYLGKTPYDFIGRRIIRYVKYKAWQKGLVAMTSKPYYASTRCYHCDAPIAKHNTEYQNPSPNFYGGKNFVCKEGHRGSTALNSARNLGKGFYQKFYQGVA